LLLSLLLTVHGSLGCRRRQQAEAPSKSEPSRAEHQPAETADSTGTPEEAVQDHPMSPDQVGPKAAGVTGRTTGQISGTVRFIGPVPDPPAIPGIEDPYCQNQIIQRVGDAIEVNESGNLASVLVWVSDGIPSEIEYLPSFEPEQLIIQDCQYQPYVFGIMTGQPLMIKSLDSTLFRVHAHPIHNEEFNLGFLVADVQVERVFSNEEIWIPITCDVHPWMTAYCAVLSHPFFDVTDDQGRFNITGIPFGPLEISARHPALGTQSMTISLEPDSESRIQFEFRAPTSGP
jgi:hypothetical protein